MRIIDYWRWNDFLDWRLWADDRLHMNHLGHERFASRVLAQLGLPVCGHRSGTTPEVQLTAREKVEQEARWVREFALPWIGRRLEGHELRRRCEPQVPGVGPRSLRPGLKN